MEQVGPLLASTRGVTMWWNIRPEDRIRAQPDDAPRPVVLLAQAKEPILYVLEQYLSSKGYGVRIARNRTQALAETTRGELAAAIVDPELPGEGPPHLGEIHRRLPGVPVLEFPRPAGTPGDPIATRMLEEVLAPFTWSAHVGGADATVVTVVSAVG